MQRGDRIKVIAYGGEELERVVVEEGGDYVVVCLEDEFLAAQREKREPRGVGFNKKYVVTKSQEQTAA